MDQELRATAELARRHNDGLEMFRAMETQLPVFESQASELLILGGNRSAKTVSAAIKFSLSVDVGRVLR